MTSLDGFARPCESSKRSVSKKGPTTQNKNDRGVVGLRKISNVDFYLAEPEMSPATEPNDGSGWEAQNVCRKAAFSAPTL